MRAVLQVQSLAGSMYRPRYLRNIVRFVELFHIFFRHLTSAFLVTLGGAVLFLLFGVLYLYQVFTDSTADDVHIPIINHAEDT